MKFNQHTIDVLNNFSGIYESIILRKGNVIRTATPFLDVFASATVPDSFDREVPIHDLKKFLSVLSLFKGQDPDVTFTDSHAVITAGDKTLEYVLSDGDHIKNIPDRDPNMPEPAITFDVKAEDLSNVTKALSVLEVSELMFSADETGVSMKALKSSNSSKGRYTVKFSSEPHKGAKLAVRIPKLTLMKLANDDYTVSVHEVYVKLASPNVTYWIPALTTE